MEELQERIKDNLINSGINVNTYHGIDVDSIAKSIANTTTRDLENHGFIVNATDGTVIFNEDYIALNSEWFQQFTIKAHKVYLQPGEIGLVHSGLSITNAYKDMKVLIQGNDAQFNVRRRFVYVWNGNNLKEHTTIVKHEAARIADRNEPVAIDQSPFFSSLCAVVIVVGIVCITVVLVALFSFLSDVFFAMHYGTGKKYPVGICPA